MSMVVAPAKLPFAPRPYSTELLSSWLLRVAAANLVSLRELLPGFEGRYGTVLTNVPIDYAIPDAAVAALSQFCRVPPETIEALDLRRRVPHLNSALLLRYHQNPSLFWCPRCSLRRVRYAFCPRCLASQRVMHVRWDWCVACLIRCAVHRGPLLDDCPACGEPDPLPFQVSMLPRFEHAEPVTRISPRVWMTRTTFRANAMSSPSKRPTVRCCWESRLIPRCSARPRTEPFANLSKTCFNCSRAT